MFTAQQIADRRIVIRATEAARKAKADFCLIPSAPVPPASIGWESLDLSGFYNEMRARSPHRNVTFVGD